MTRPLLRSVLASCALALFTAVPGRAVIAPDAAAPAPGEHIWSATPEERARGREARKRVGEWYAQGGVKNDRKLYVVTTSLRPIANRSRNTASASTAW